MLVERRPRWAAAALAVASLVAGCTPAPASSGSPSVATSPTTAARPFTVMTTEAPHSLDPALATTGADAIAALDLFQRLLVFHATTGELKPDAADCQFSQPAVYECTLTKGITFSNGHALTSSDVAFSIDRARRLNVAGTSVKLLGSLQRVEAVNDQTVRFYLAWPDTQFGVGLAAPAASIVDEESYAPDAARPDASAPVGSGPFALASADAGGLSLVRNETYVGATKAALPAVRLAFAADSAAAEQAMSEGTADVVWRSLDAAALARLAMGATKTDLVAVPLPEARLTRLAWNPASALRAQAEVRYAVSSALQADRTLTSLVPPKVAGSAASFAVGARPNPTHTPGAGGALTLGYSSKAPGLADVASLLGDRLEAWGFGVQLRPDAADADLTLTDTPAWVNTALGWLQPYLDAPLPGSQAKLVQLTQTASTMTDAGARDAVLAELQQQAAADATELPVSLGPETLWARKGVTVATDTYGPCWQLGLWGFSQ